MSKTDQDLRREAIRTTLALRAGTAPDASAVAEATLSTWQQIAIQLEPVIGARGVDALFSRSLHVTGKAFPWLAIRGVQGNSATSLASVKACLQSREPSDATAAAQALLATFTELLANLIGESLTERLLGLVWAPPIPESEREIQP